MKPDQWERHADDLALARYAVISPIVSRKLSPAEKGIVKGEVLAAVHLFPDGNRKVSRRALDRWLGWYDVGHTTDEGEIVTAPGIEALRPLPRQDKGVSRAVEDTLIERAVFLRREDPTRSTSKILELLAAEAEKNGHPAPRLKEATLAFHLRQQKVTKRDLKRAGRVYQRYEQPRRNSTWQGDWSQGFLVPDPSSPSKPRMCHLHAFLDDHSRYVVHAEFYFRQNLPCLEDCFRKAILHGGVPEKVYWDNGAVYHSRQIQMVAARLKTQLIFSTPYCPEGKGKIERWFRTVKESFYPEARAAGLESLAELNEFFWGWLERSYHARVHSETEQTPLARWEQGVHGVRFPEPASLVDLFLWEEKRRVDKTGCIHIAGNPYAVAEHLVGREVVVRFDPFDLTRIRLYENGVFARVLEPQSLVSRTFRKATPTKQTTEPRRESSAAYRDQMANEFRKRAKDTIRNARRDDGPVLSQPEFFAVLQEYLGDRQLTAGEAKLVEDFYHRNAPLAKIPVQSSLLQAFEAKGPKRHIRYYLDFVQAARFNNNGEKQS